MKVMTILGTRPEIIRLSLIIGKLDALLERHILVHTGQNYDYALSDHFFEQMGIREPDYRLTTGAHSFGRQIGQMFAQVEQVIVREQPDRILVLGDTNSALCAILGERMGIPVFHMEAGNRCHDTRVPEEINRKIIDAVSTFNLPYTSLSRDNLLREGVNPQRIWVTGNPIYEVLWHYHEQIEQSPILHRLGLRKEEYVLVTAHRAETVDHPSRLKVVVEGLHLIAERLKISVICSIHPRTRERIMQFGITARDPRIRFCQPFGFFDFIRLQKGALCVVTDSGTVQEESCILGIPAVTIRQSTERPETILCGSNTLAGLDAQRIAESVRLMTRTGKMWQRPEGYTVPNVSDKVSTMIAGGLHYV